MAGRVTRIAAIVCAALMVAPAAAQDAAAPAAATPEAAPAAPGAASARTLADLRADLKALAAELKSLRGELNASGAAGFKSAGGDKAIDRMNAMERELSRLTGETERLKNRLAQVVRDGTNRVGDIEFRLCEMEDGCDLAALTTPTLGEQGGGAAGIGDLGAGIITGHPATGGTGAALGGGVTAKPLAQVPLTADEQRAFEAATAAMQAGDFPRAADLFGQFARTHADSPAAAEALFLRGAALDSAGDAKGATAAWLSAFAAAPGGPRAPDALLGLSRVAAAGKPASEGCLYLTELTTRFGGTPQADEAARRSGEAGCAALMDGAAHAPADPAATLDPEAASDLAHGG